MNLVFDLNKAFDKSKLVQVQVTVQGKNGVFQRMQWKNPADVKSTDKVIGNQAVLDAFLKKQKALKDSQNVASGKFDMSKWTALKNANDKAGAIKYAKECGLVWNESGNAGINWMRCCMAVNKISGAKITVKTTKPSEVKAKGVKLKVDGIAGFDSMSKKDKIKNLLANGNSKDDLMSYFKGIGVTWPTTDKSGNPLPEGITWMRASMAIQSWLEGKTLADLGGDVNISTDDKSTNQAKPVEETKPKPIDPNIKITADMTERKKNLANLINKITDEEELELIKSSHMVAEDDNAKNYIKNTFFKAYDDWKKGKSARGNSSYGRASQGLYHISKTNSDKFGGMFKGVAKKIFKSGLERLCNNNSYGVNIETLEHPREIMTAISGTSYYSSLYTRGQHEASVTPTSLFSCADLFHEMDNFSVFSKDSDNQYLKELDNSRSYNIYNSDRFDLSKHGFNLVLNKIAKDIPSTKSEVDRVKKCYEDLINLCGGDPCAMETLIIGKNNYTRLKEKAEKAKIELDAYRTYIEVFKDMKNKYGLSETDLQYSASRCNSDSYIEVYKDGKLMIDPLTNESVKVKLVDYNLEFMKKWNKDLTDVISPSHNSSFEISAFFASKDKFSFDELLSEPSKIKDIRKEMDEGLVYWHSYYLGNIIERVEAEKYNNITEDSYCKIRRKLLEMFGQKIVVTTDSKGSKANWTDVDTSNWTSKDWDEFASSGKNVYQGNRYCITATGDNEELDTVLANMQYINANKNFLEAISYRISNSTASNANKQGRDYDGNFDYVNGRIGDNGGYIYGKNGSTKKYTADEINAKIKEQLGNAPVITTEKRKQLKEFTDKNGTIWGTGVDPSALNIGAKLEKAYSYNLDTEESFDDFKDTPIHDIITSQLQNMALYCPQMRNSRTNTDKKLFELVANKLGNKPYVPPIEKKADNSLSVDNSSSVDDIKNAKLKTLREEAFAVVNCSLATADDNKRTSVETEIKHNWDISNYHEDKKYHISGKRIYTHIKAEFNGVYVINNSGNQERLDKIAEDTGEKPVKLYHGTNRSGACGITGVDNKFSWTVSGAKTAGRMLGDGVYLASLVGKSAGYLGTWGSGYGRDGCILICDVLKGKEYVSSDYWDAKSNNKPSKVDTVAMMAGTNTGRATLRADEWCVNKADRVSPRIIVDMKAVNR